LQKYARYSAAKEGIVGLTRRVAGEMGEYGVVCNAIRPGAATRFTLTDEMKEARKRADMPEISIEERRKKCLMQ